MSLIYCVEDDDGIRELVSCALRSGGYKVKAFPKAKPFYEELKGCVPALVLLDIMLPDEDGLTILGKLKSDPRLREIPIIMLTAKTSELEKVRGLESGADDYITKPFGVMELLSRIKAVLRRTAKQSGESEVFEIGGCSLDASRRIVTYNGTEVTLTYKEFELLMYLMRHQSIAVTRDKLMEMVWGYEFAGETRTVDMHIKTLRQKLEAAGCRDIIKTVRGVGYKCG
ncbi:response regulator transcription factor [Ruminococcus sp. Marseille-P6503]|uniref:response regulator transcription factor n=1 Tax=Ruminococcus sp. Marseille-P6503 TaxID=2364796 RepID=UPI000F53FB18|nr:response regulator transcription factor [Ruminococcus sp. Marseille-P6503]